MRRIRLIPIAAFATLLALPAVVSAHAELVSSDPAPGERLDEAPSEVTVTFDGELEPESGFTVTDADGQEVGAGELDLDVAERNVLRGAVAITEPGVYTVTWTAVSDDGHPEEGSFVFGYDADASGTSTAPNTALPRPADDPFGSTGAALLVLAAATAGRRLASGVQRRMRAPRRTAVIIAATAVVLLAGCVSDTKPDEATCRAPAIDLEVTLTASALTGDTLSACRDQAVTITVTPEVDGVIHIHGYDEHVPATEVFAGTPLDLEFAAETIGQFPIEFHAADDPQGVEVGIFAVYEP